MRNIRINKAQKKEVLLSKRRYSNRFRNCK